MNAYFFKMTQAEKNDILEQHKELYNGYVTNNIQSNMQPLYIQDFANDKEGITVNNKGDVKTYTNININEMKYDGKSTGLFSNEEDGYVTFGEQLDKIADDPKHFEHGTFDDNDEIEFELEIDDLDDETEDDMIVLGFNSDEIDEEMIEPIQEQITKTLDMFKRFKKY